MPPHALRFDRYELQPQERRLLADGEPVVLGARAFDVLVTLVERAGSLVSKNELLERVWAGLVVEEANLTVQVSNLRKLLGGELIATIPGRGYRFTGQVVQPGAAAPVPAATPTPAPTPAVPAPAAPALVGRAADLGQLRAALAQPGCVTLVGPAGVGKTSLARGLAAGWAAGAVWVDLAPLSEAAQVQVALARALGRPAQEPVAALAAHIGARLVVLDNAEHLIDAVAALVAALLQAAPALPLLATCQLPLSVPAERVHRVEPLALPADDAGLAGDEGALALFVARARAADHRFAPGPEALPLLRAICRQLDGLPLALEMAAARVPALGLQGLHDALARRFAVLTRGTRTAAERHRTLQAALDWSHGLLSAEEQRLFRALAVFAGGFTLDLAVALAASDTQDRWAVVDTLATLVERSLVSASGGADDAHAPRYHLLETMRAYAWERLQASGELQAVQARHAQVMLALFGAAADAGATEAEVARGLAEHDNAREATAWAAAHDAPLALDLSAKVVRAASFVAWRGEAFRWLEACEAVEADPSVPLLLRARWWAERTRQLLISHHPGARRAAERSLALAREGGDAGVLFQALVSLVRASREADAALEQACLELPALLAANPQWSPRQQTLLHGTLAAACDLRNDVEGALRHRRRELELARQNGERRIAEVAEANIIASLFRLERFEEALVANEALMARLAPGGVNLAYAWNTQVALLVQLGHHERVRGVAEEVSALFERYQMPYYLERWALLLAAEGRPRAAVQVLGRQEALFQRWSIAPTRPSLTCAAGIRERVLPLIGEEGWEAALAQGRGLDTEATLALLATAAAEA